MAGGPVVGQAAIRVVADASGLDSSLGRQVDTVAKSAGSRLSSTLGRAAKIGVAALGTVAVAAGGIGVKTAMSMQTAKTSFETMLGSAKKADAFLKQLSDFAAKTPFEFPELQTAASSLISAGIEAGKVIPIMTTLGNVTSGMGTGSEGVKRATIALQQMSAAGKITGEDLNQLRDAGVPVFDLLAAATGKSKAEVAGLAQAGKLGSKELGQLMSALESGKGLERFNGLMEKQSQTLAGTLSTLKDNVQMGLAKAMEPVMPLLQKAVNFAATLTASLMPKLAAVMKEVVGGITAFGAAWKANDGDITSSGFPGFMERVAFVARKVWDVLSPMVQRISDARNAIGGDGGGFASMLPALGGVLPLLSVFLGKMGGFSGIATAAKGAMSSMGPVIKTALTSPLGLASLAFGGLLVAMLATNDGGATVSKFITDLGAKIAGFATMIANNLPGIMAKVIPALVGVFQTIATAIPQLITTLVSTLLGLMPVLLRAAVSLFTALLTALTQILPVLIQGVIGLVMSLAKMLPTLVPILVQGAVALLTGIVQAVNVIVPAVISAVTTLVNAIVAMLPTLLPILLNAGIALLMALIKAANQILPPLIQAVVAVIDAIVGMLPTLIPILLNAAVTLFTALVNALPKILPVLLKAAIAVIDAIVKLLPTLIPLILQAAITMFMALVNSLPKILPMLLQAVLQVIWAVVRMLPTLIPQLISAAVTLFMALVTAVPKILGALLKAMGSVLSSLWKSISDTFGRWKTDLGKAWDTIVGAIGKAWDKVKEIAKAPIKWVVDVVVNKGIIGAFNWLSEKIGGPHIDDVKIPGFERGGVVPGGFSRKDNRLIAARSGEGILIPEAVSRLGGSAAIKRINDLARRGIGTDAPFGVGGLFEWISDRWQNVKNAWDWVYDKASAVYQAVTNPGDFIKNKIGDFMRNLPGGVKTIAQYGGAMVTKGVGVIVQKVKDLWNAFTGAFAQVTSPQNAALGPAYTGPISTSSVMPVNGPITASYGHYPSGGRHTGMDFGVPTGTLVKAFRAGRVAFAGWSNTGFGNLVMLNHGAGLQSLYGHNKSLLVRTGQMVQKASGIALSDSTGNSTGPHVHFEIRKNGVSQPPWPYLLGRSFDRGGWLPPHSLTLAHNGTNRRERVGFDDASGPTYITVEMNVSVDDLAKMSQIGDFLAMLDNARVVSRGSERSGRVSA